MRISKPLHLLIAIPLLTIVMAQQPAAAAPSHIRTTSAALRTLIAAGIERSPTFRALVDQLEASDVVVYVDFRTFNERGLGGQILFVGAAGGRRYVQVFVAPLQDLDCLAILGHELRHAVEIASAPSVVDSASMARCYERIGYHVPPHANRFDTSNAVESGRRVLYEARTGVRVAE